MQLSGPIDRWPSVNVLDAWTNAAFLHSFLMLDDAKKNQASYKAEREEMLVSLCLYASYDADCHGSSDLMNPTQFIRSQSSSISQQPSPNMNTSILSRTYAPVHEPSSTYMLAQSIISDPEWT